MDIPDPFLVYQIYHSCCLTSGFDVQWQDYLRKTISPDMVSSAISARKLVRTNERWEFTTNRDSDPLNSACIAEEKTRKQMPSWKAKACHVCHGHPCNLKAQTASFKAKYRFASLQVLLVVRKDTLFDTLFSKRETIRWSSHVKFTLVKTTSDHTLVFSLV